MSVADQVRAGLIRRGIAPHIAEAFVWNFQHESGLNPSIVERVPNVHGTRGRGLYQLTGSRRNAFEQRYGDDYSIDNQLDWLMHELQGPENRAWQRIQAAPDTGQAAAAIVTHFLRPAEQHRVRRVAEYTGGNPPALSDAPVPSGGPSRPPSVFNPPPEAGNALASFGGGGGVNALADPEQARRMNALAAMEQYQNRASQNRLDPREFMVAQPLPPLQPIPTFG